jgi:predicted metal-dependent HD superfamily phosphohydrolase
MSVMYCSFEITFKTELARLNAKSELAQPLLKEIRSSYSKPGRYYHTLIHLDKLLTELLPVRDNIHDWQTLIFSIAYHDIIYSTRRQDNEEKSAALARQRLTELNRPVEQIKKCSNQILATKGHQPDSDSDTNYFTDADLAILGSDPESYSKYAGQIRKEYRFYPWFLYKPGRQKVLSHFLAMQQIYKTGWFKEKYESQARYNLANELAILEAGR